MMNPNAPINPETMLTLNLKAGAVQYLLNLLGKQPLAESLPLFNDVTMQVQTQLTPPGDLGDVPSTAHLPPGSPLPVGHPGHTPPKRNGKG